MTRPRMRAGIILVCCMAGALFVAGCGEEAPPPKQSALGSLESDAAADRKLEYEEDMARSIEALEAPEAMPLQRAINTANRQALSGAAARWDRALRIAESANPPKDIRTEHAQLLSAMKQLSDWNHRIANAAPRGVRQTKAVAAEARNSAPARAYGDAVAAIEDKGYSFGPDAGAPAE